MAQKAANIYARIEPDVKERAETILNALGIPASSAINMFYKQIILHRGLPFDVSLPPTRQLDISRMSVSEQRICGYESRKDKVCKSSFR